MKSKYSIRRKCLLRYNDLLGITATCAVEVRKNPHEELMRVKKKKLFGFCKLSELERQTGCNNSLVEVADNLITSFSKYRKALAKVVLQTGTYIETDLALA